MPCPFLSQKEGAQSFHSNSTFLYKNYYSLPKKQMMIQQMVLKKIDIHQNKNIGGLHKLVQSSRKIFDSQPKIKNPNFQSNTSKVLIPTSLIRSNPILLHQQKKQHIRNQRLKSREANQQLRTSRHTPYNKTYNNNYKSFPQRGLLSNPYTIKNTTISIPIFTKRIRLEEHRNDVLAKKMSLQLQSARTSESKVEKRSPSVNHYRAKSARAAFNQFIKERGDNPNFCPWEVQPNQVEQL